MSCAIVATVICKLPAQSHQSPFEYPVFLYPDTFFDANPRMNDP